MALDLRLGYEPIIKKEYIQRGYRKLSLHILGRCIFDPISITIIFNEYTENNDRELEGIEVNGILLDNWESPESLVMEIGEQIAEQIILLTKEETVSDTDFETIITLLQKQMKKDKIKITDCNL